MNRNFKIKNSQEPYNFLKCIHLLNTQIAEELGNLICSKLIKRTKFKDFYFSVMVMLRRVTYNIS